MVNDKAPRRNEGYEDLRDLLERFEEMGEVAHVDGADWNLEVGAVSEMTAAAGREGLRLSCLIILKATLKVPVYFLALQTRSVVSPLFSVCQNQRTKLTLFEATASGPSVSSNSFPPWKFQPAR